MTQNKLLHDRIPLLGITGGVGSGKSVVMQILSEEYGAGIILADQVGHDLMEPGAVCYQEILHQFGQSILDEKGQIDRHALSALVFDNKEKLQTLNALTHTAIRREILDRIAAYRKEGRVPFIALEAALLIEENYEELLDCLWYIYVTEENRIKRLMESRGYSREKCRQIMASQLPEEVFRAHCQKVIDNNGSCEQTAASVRAALNDPELFRLKQPGNPSDKGREL